MITLSLTEEQFARIAPILAERTPGREDRLRAWVIRKLDANGPMTLGELKRQASSRDRSYISAAVASLVAAQAIVESGGTFHRTRH